MDMRKSLKRPSTGKRQIFTLPSACSDGTGGWALGEPGLPNRHSQRGPRTDLQHPVADQRQKLETDWEVDLSYSLYGQARFRVNAYFQRGTIGAAFRLVPVVIKTVEELGLPQIIHSFCHKPRGFVLVTGPTGSGKSTTLAAIIDEINSTRADHIVTIEDPIEFLHQHKKCVVNQREVGTDTKAFRWLCARRCGRIPTSSSSERCATWKRSRSRSPRPKRVTWSLQRFTRRTVRRPSTA